VADGRLPARAFLVPETTPVTPPKPRLLDRVRAALRARHYSRRTEKAYDVQPFRFSLLRSVVGMM
jgi:hypothetical protein